MSAPLPKTRRILQSTSLPSTAPGRLELALRISALLLAFALLSAVVVLGHLRLRDRMMIVILTISVLALPAGRDP
jgi:hypothetical protein